MDCGFDLDARGPAPMPLAPRSTTWSTPTNFEWEVGLNPIVVDETTWEPTTHQGISIWGHTPVGQTIDKLAQFKTGAQSLLHPEPAVPALAGTNIRN